MYPVPLTEFSEVCQCFGPYHVPAHYKLTITGNTTGLKNFNGVWQLEHFDWPADYPNACKWQAWHDIDGVGYHFTLNLRRLVGGVYRTRIEIGYAGTIEYLYEGVPGCQRTGDEANQEPGKDGSCAWVEDYS